MASYGIVILSLIKHLRAEFRDATQPFYADNSSALGTFANTKLYFNSVILLGLGHRYYPEPSKSVLILHPNNTESGKRFGLRHGFKFCTGVHYLGGFIGDDE